MYGMTVARGRNSGRRTVTNPDSDVDMRRPRKTNGRVFSSFSARCVTASNRQLQPVPIWSASASFANIV